MTTTPESISIKMREDAGMKVSETEYKYLKLVDFLKQEIAMRKYVCTTNHAVLLDNAKTLLKEIGEL
jgi:hypothetical protein